MWSIYIIENSGSTSIILVSVLSSPSSLFRRWKGIHSFVLICKSWSSPVACSRVFSNRQIQVLLRGGPGAPGGLHQWQTRSAHSSLVWRLLLQSSLICVNPFWLDSVWLYLFYWPLASVSTDVKALLTRLGYFGDSGLCYRYGWRPCSVATHIMFDF
jgi:hypothetical protein